mmetsp:Transcript_99215/g.190527  ORF Transcript_99215/g.190527 Transcript_99215/m.190527 type:complete len:385 (+) Transcript_99215:68-1222(+)
MASSHALVLAIVALVVPATCQQHSFLRQLQQASITECGDTINNSTASCAQREDACTSGRDKAQCDRCVYKIHCEGHSSYTGSCYGTGLACLYAGGTHLATYCFPSSATVQVLVGPSTITTERMDNLKVGDRVLTAAGFSEVYAFMDHTTKPEVQYLKFRTDSGAELRLTKEHIIFAHVDRQPVLAAEVKVGDFLWVADRLGAPGVKKASFKLSRVVSVTAEHAKGAHAPLTVEGSLIVDGVLASSSAGAQTLKWGGFPLLTGHKLVMLLHAPLRFLYKFMPRVGGPEWHSAELGRHLWTQWVLDHFGWLQAINLEYGDLEVAFTSLSVKAWAAALVQVFAAGVLLLLDAVLLLLADWRQTLLVLYLLWAGRQVKKGQMAYSKHT